MQSPTCFPLGGWLVGAIRSTAFAVLLLLGNDASAWNPAAGDFSKSDPGHVRVLAWNVLGNFISAPATDDEFQRILTVLQPDIIGMEEIAAGLTAAQIQARLDALMPLGGTNHWTVHLGKSDGFNQCILATRHPQSLAITDTTPASEVRGVNGALVDLPNATYAKDIYVMVIHLKAFAGGTNTARRQTACDALAKWFGDLRSAGGSVNLPADTPALVMGDTNFVDANPQQPEVTLRTGDIIDNATYGPDVKGDWDNTDLVDVTPADPYTGDTDTYPSGTTGPTSRIDRFYYTDSAAAVARSFVFNTRAMSAGARTAAGLLAADSETISDHLAIVTDFAVTMAPVTLSLFRAE